MGDEGTTLPSVVNHIIFESNLQKKLEATDVVINALNKDIMDKTKAKEFQKFLHNIFDDKGFMRKLSFYSQLKDVPELSIEYSGIDYLSMPDFQYDELYEDRIVDIKKKLQKFLGALLREFSKGVEINL